MTLHSSSNVLAQSSQDVPTTAPSKTANNTTSEIGASASLVKFIDLARWEHNNDNHYHWEGKVSLKDLPRIYALGDEHHDNDQPLDVMLDIQKKGDVGILATTHHGRALANLPALPRPRRSESRCR